MPETIHDQVDTIALGAQRAPGAPGQKAIDHRRMKYWMDRLGIERMRRAVGDPNELEAQHASAFKYLMLGEIIADNRERAMQVSFPVREIFALQTLYIRALNRADICMNNCVADPARKRILPGKENFFKLAVTGENLLHAVNEEDYNGRLDLDPFESSVLYGVQYLFADYPPYVDMYEALAWGVDALHRRN